MADSYHIIDGKVVPYSGGRKCNDTDAWRDATPLELQLQEQLEEYERTTAAQEAEIEALRAEVDLRDSVIATHAADTREYQKQISQAEACAKRLVEALRNSADALERLAFATRAPNAHTPQLVELAIAMRTAALAQQPAAVDRARFRKAPCYLCGYNGPGYFQPETHPCASLYHAAPHQEPKS